MGAARRPGPLGRALRWLGYIVGGLLGLVALAALAVYAISEARVAHTYSTQPAPVAVRQDAASVERGRHLVHNVMACVDCHGENLAGSVFVDDPALGRAVAANLTTGAGGVLGQMSDADIVRVLRHGVKPDGRSLFVMPVDDYVALSQPDVEAIIAYLRSLPPVDNVLPPSELRPVGRVLVAMGGSGLLSAEKVPQEGGFPPTVPAGATPEYGLYVARTSGCMGCHGTTLSGGAIPNGPPNSPIPLNITPGSRVASWTDAQLAEAIRTGRRPDGTLINAFMPYKAYSGMTDEEIRAVILYLRSVPAKPFGGR
jgi:mono/diheme cytochrome c family protein